MVVPIQKVDPTALYRRQNLDLVIARLETISANNTDDPRGMADEALACARALLAAPPTKSAAGDLMRDWKTGSKSADEVCAELFGHFSSSPAIPAQAVDALRNAGSKLANIAFNLAQRAGEMLTGDDCAVLDSCRKKWDAALSAQPKAAPVNSPTAVMAGGLSPTDLSKRLREYAASSPRYQQTLLPTRDLIAACDEIDRYYTGMRDWKATAETKDRQPAMGAGDLSAPDGWQMVPVTPNDEMMNAALSVAIVQHNMLQIAKNGLRRNWAAMLAAAPRPTAGGAGSHAAPKLLGQVVMYPNYSTVIQWVGGVTPPSGTKLYTIPDDDRPAANGAAGQKSGA